MLDCPFLESVKMGTKCFGHTTTLILQSLRNLREFCVGKFSFMKLNKLILKNLEKCTVEFTKTYTKTLNSDIDGVSDTTLRSFQQWMGFR